MVISHSNLVSLVRLCVQCVAMLVGVASVSFIGERAMGAVVTADPAADWVAYNGTNAGSIGGGASGWSYHASNAASGGTEAALTPKVVGLEGAFGFGGTNQYSLPAVLGDNFNGGDYEIFGDGQPNNAVVGTDLVLHPGNAVASAFVIVRYTASVTGTANIAGSFRNLVSGNGMNAVDVFVYHNSTQLFNYDTPASGVETLSQANGTFNLTSISITSGDTISFAVGNNGEFSGDESALRAQISITPIPEPATALFGLCGLALAAAWRKRRAA